MKKVLIAIGGLLSLAGVLFLTAATDDTVGSQSDYAQYLMGPTTGTNGCTVAAQSASNVLVFIDISLQRDVGIALRCSEDAAGTANITAHLVPCMSASTNYMDTTRGFDLLTAMVSATARTCITTNLDDTKVGGFKWLCVQYLTNAAASANVTNCQLLVSTKRIR
jgi:hypothetical protein